MERVAVFSGGEAEAGKYDGASAETALFVPTVEAVPRKEINTQSGHLSEEDDEDLENDSAVYLTESFRTWECHYLKRLAKAIHSLVCSELDRSEEALFMVFCYHDTNLDGVVRSEEAERLMKALETAAPDALKESGGPMDKDGAISFLALLQWYSQGSGEYKETGTFFNMTSLTVGLLGSGFVANDTRIDELEWLELRANIVGYRRLYQQLRQMKEETKIAEVCALESQKSLEEVMPEYHNILVAELEGDAEHLFELFNEVDISGNLMLEESELESFLRLLDTGATEADLKRYIQEINMADGPLSFASLIDWWDQARNVKASLVSEKGMVLLASVKARVMSKNFSFYSDSEASKKWKEAADRSPEDLQLLRDAYVRTISEVREYKMERDLRAAEVEAARL